MNRPYRIQLERGVAGEAATRPVFGAIVGALARKRVAALGEAFGIDGAGVFAMQQLFNGAFG